MMHASDADAPPARATDARPMHEAHTAARISPPTRRLQPEGASGAKGGPNGGPSSAVKRSDGRAIRPSAHANGALQMIAEAVWANEVLSPLPGLELSLGGFGIRADHDAMWAKSIAERDAA